MCRKEGEWSEKDEEGGDVRDGGGVEGGRWGGREVGKWGENRKASRASSALERLTRTRYLPSHVREHVWDTPFETPPLPTRPLSVRVGVQVQLHNRRVSSSTPIRP